MLISRRGKGVGGAGKPHWVLDPGCFCLRPYTFWACGGCGAALIGACLLRKKNPLFDVERFLAAYAICLIPFLLVNGLLTALPVVLYNDSENIGLRIYTIPAEDVFYGMLLVLGNVWGLTLIKSVRTRR